MESLCLPVTLEAADWFISSIYLVFFSYLVGMFTGVKRLLPTQASLLFQLSRQEEMFEQE